MALLQQLLCGWFVGLEPTPKWCAAAGWWLQGGAAEVIPLYHEVGSAVFQAQILHHCSENVSEL